MRYFYDLSYLDLDLAGGMISSSSESASHTSSSSESSFRFFFDEDATGFTAGDLVVADLAAFGGDDGGGATFGCCPSDGGSFFYRTKMQLKIVAVTTKASPTFVEPKKPRISMLDCDLKLLYSKMSISVSSKSTFSIFR